MNRGLKMLMATRSDRERRMAAALRSNYGMESNYDVESRFRDRRGREHYDDGHFAPQGNANRWLPPYYDVDINRYEYELERPESNYRMNMRDDRNSGREGGGNRGAQRDARSAWDNYQMDSGYSRMDMRGGDSNMHMIGFERNDMPRSEMRMASDASMPSYREMDRMPGNKAQSGGAMSQHIPKFDEKMAKEWTAKMQNEDGTHGPHWTMEQTKRVMEQRGIKEDPARFYAAINMMYSDYSEVAKKINANNMDFFAEMAKAFLQDKDAGAQDKLAAYYEYVVKG